VLYLYCWILLRVYRELPGRNLNGGHQYDNGAVSDADSDTSDNTTQQRPHRVTDEVLSNNGHSEAQSSRDPLMPVAQTLPLFGDADSHMAHAAIVQRNIRNDIFITLPHDEEIMYEDQDDTDVSWRPCGSRSSKRNDDSTAQSSRPSTKRRKTAAKLPVRNNVHTEVLRNTRTSHANREREMDDAVYPSQHIGAPTLSNGIGGSSNLSAPPRESASVCSVASAEPIMDNPIERDADDYDDVGDDADSVLGDSRDPPIILPSMTIPPTVPVADARVTFPIDMTPQSPSLEDRRHRLASKMEDLLPLGLKKPDVLHLSGLVELLEALSTMDHLHLQDVYGRDLMNRQRALKRWVECLKSLLSFYEVTGFKEDVTTRNAFIKTIPADHRIVARKSFLQTRSSLSDWRAEAGVTEEEFSRDVASVFFNLAFWKDTWVTLEEVETWTLGFTEELLTWFRQ
jgi:hypothetical protein